MYKIILPNFQGPFDLLLYFIKRDELNIYDIPISKIADEFLNYIKIMSHFDLDLAGEFIVMAANLMYIKTQMLLPRQKNEDGFEVEDPRKQLVQNILEYIQFKEAAKNLSSLANSHKFILYKENLAAEYAQANISSAYKNATLFDLLKAFALALNRKNTSAKPVHVVEIFNVNIDDKKTLIKDVLALKKRTTFFELIKEQDRKHVIVTFLAILEMMKQKQIFISQNEPFGDIIISGYPEENINQ